MKFLTTSDIIIFIVTTAICVHIPRLYIEIKSRFFKKSTKFHCEDSYQKHRNEINNGRILAWAEFECSESEWKDYVKKVSKNLLNLYRKEFNHLVKNVPDQELVSIQNTDKVLSYSSFGAVISTWIDYEKKVIRTCFNHEWCSGYFFLQYGAVIYQGESPNPAKYPNSPFISEYSSLKMLLNKPHLPISKCFMTDIQQEDMKRINYNLDLSLKPNGVSSRTYILWNVMTILNNVCSKDYNIMIPIPFNKLKNVWNNIGVIFVKWPKSGMSMKTLEITIKKNVYHAIATNLFLRGFSSSSTGTNGRKNIDLVFTSGYIKNTKIIPKYHYATFNNVSDYGIYCQTGTFGKKTSISFTFSTNQFNFEKLVKLVNEKYEYKLF